MEEMYKKSKGNAGLEGVQFQLDLLTICLLNAVRSLKGWKISTENSDAGKYDDIVVELSNGSAVLIQAKHKDNKKITKDLLFSHNSKNADFSLPKYFLSYQEIKEKYKHKIVIICSNTSVDKKGIHNILVSHPISTSSLLYEGGNCLFSTFNEDVLPELKTNAELYFDKNLQGKGIDKTVITNENMEDFLKDLQVFSNYPSGEELHKIIEQMLFCLSESSLWSKTSYHELYRKIEEWFKQPKGEYLTEFRTKAIFCEIKSDKYCESLKNFNVIFERNNFNFKESKRIFHITTQGIHLLQMLKIYRSLQGDKSKKLYINPDEDIDVQRQAIEAFQLRRFTLLIITWNGIKEKNVAMEIIGILKEILGKVQYKKVILVAEDNNELVEQIGIDHVLKLDGRIEFQDLSKDYQLKLLKNGNINFQGSRISLEELIVTQTSEDYTKFLYSEMLEQLVKMNDIKVGEQPSHLDEDTARYYIHRTFEKGSAEAGNSIEIPEDNIYDETNKTILIADSAGMGKSTILTKLAVTLKEKYPHLWIIRINLNEYTKVLRDTLRKEIDSISVTELLNSKRATKLANEFEKFIFSMKEKVVLMLDAVDEISPDYTELILDLIAQCEKGPNFAKILVTTRPHMTPDLEAALTVGLFKIKPFLKRDQINFLTRYWIHNLQLRDETAKKTCEQYAELLVEKMSSWVDDQYFFAAVPLHVRMLAEIFQKNVAWKEPTDWEGCEQYLNGTNAEPILPEKFNIAKLYDMFIEKKRAVFVDKGNPTGNSIANFAINQQFNECLRYHHILALREIFGETVTNLLPGSYCSDKAMDMYMLQIGLVQKSEDEFQFVHITFAEYFIALSFLKELQLKKPNIEHQRLLFDKILRNRQFKVIRTFLNNLLQETITLPDNIFENYCSTCESNSNDADENILFLLAEEGCVEILQLILKSINFKVIKNKQIKLDDLEKTRLEINVENKISNTLNDLKILVQESGVNIKNKFDDTPLHFAAKNGQLRMVKFLFEQGADITAKGFQGNTALHSAAWRGDLGVIKYIVNHAGDVNVKNSHKNTALHSAATTGMTDIVKYLVEVGANINAKGHGGHTPLHGSILWGNLHTAKCLVDLKADVNIKDDNGYTALAHVSSKGYLEVAKHLVEVGANINTRNNDGRTPLHLASELGKLDTVKYLVESGADINIKDNKGYTALVSGASHGCLDIVKYFVQLGVDISIRDNEGNTVLHVASSKNMLETVKYLVERGAELNDTNGKGETVLHSAALRGELETVKYLVEVTRNLIPKDNNGRTPLHSAAILGEVDVIKYFVEHGIDIDIRDNDGKTALHWAVFRASLYTVKRLVELGANINIGDNNGWTILHSASMTGRLDILRYVVEAGGNINITDNKGQTSLHLATTRGYLNVVSCLIQLGADFDKKDINGYSALHFSVITRKIDTVKCLLEHGVNVEIRDNKGCTAMHLAAKMGDLDTVEYFIEFGADMTIGDNDGCTSLHWAAAKGQLNIVKYLAQFGVDVNCKNNYGRTPLHVASKYDYLDIIKYLVEQGADMTVGDNDGRNSLHFATSMGMLETVKYFVEMGVDVNSRDSDGHTVAHMFAIKCTPNDISRFIEDAGQAENVLMLYGTAVIGAMTCIEYLVEHGLDLNIEDNNQRTALHIAVTCGVLEVVKYFTALGAVVECRDSGGRTPLHLAAEEDKMDMVNYLAQLGAMDINIGDSNGRTSLHLASKNGHLDAVKYLKELGADIKCRDTDGRTPMHLASAEDKIDIVKYFIELGTIDINICDSRGHTVLHLASENGYLDIIKYLKECEIDIKCRDINGRTPLHLAAAEGKTDVIKHLVDLGAMDINIDDGEGRTALHLASKNGHLDAVKCLKELGADIHCRDKNGQTAVQLAIENGHSNTVKYLE